MESTLPPSSSTRARQQDGPETTLTKRVEFFELLQAVRENYVIHQPKAVLIEDASSGVAIVQELQRTTGFPIIPVRPEGSKENRVAAVSPLFEAGKVKLRRNALWLDSFISETAAFPAGRFDDQIDAVALGLSALRLEIFEDARAQELQKRMGVRSVWMSR